MSESQATTIYICRTCRNAESADEDDERLGSRFARSLALKLADYAGGENVTLKAVDCLSVCKRPCTVAFSAQGKFTYLVGDLALDRDEAAVLDFASAYGESDDGITPWRARPEVVRKGVIARVPPLGGDGTLIHNLRVKSETSE